MVFKWSAISLMWLVLTSAASALAAPRAAERDTARNLMVEGDRLREAGDLTGALQSYQSAHAIMHVPTTGLAVAETQAQLGQLVEARSVALEVVSMPVTQAEPVVFATARETATALASALERRVCTLTTRVRPATAQYDLLIDDVLLPTAAQAAPFKINPGAHSVRVVAPGFAEQSRVIMLPDGDVQVALFELQSLPLIAAAEPANVAAATWTVASSARLDDERRNGRLRGFIGLGVGGVSLAVGIITGAISWSQTADIKQHCDPDHTCAAALRGDLQAANTLGNIANVSVPLGVIGIAYGAYELLTLPAATPARSQAAGLQIEVAPNGVRLRGRL